MRDGWSPCLLRQKLQHLPNKTLPNRIGVPDTSTDISQSLSTISQSRISMVWACRAFRPAAWDQEVPSLS
jgi:hypothetical protein